MLREVGEDVGGVEEADKGGPRCYIHGVHIVTKYKRSTGQGAVHLLTNTQEGGDLNVDT